MKTTQEMKATLAAAPNKLPFDSTKSPPLAARDKQSLIRWATKQQIQEVSKQLAGVKEVAVCSEVHGDYFKSGDLAYQIQEIIRAAAELFKKSQRASE